MASSTRSSHHALAYDSHQPRFESYLPDKLDTRQVVEMIKNADLYDLINISLRANEMKDETVELFIQKALQLRRVHTTATSAGSEVKSMEPMEAAVEEVERGSEDIQMVASKRKATASLGRKKEVKASGNIRVRKVTKDENGETQPMIIRGGAAKKGSAQMYSFNQRQSRE